MNHTIMIEVAAHDEDKLSESNLTATHGITFTIIPPMDSAYLRFEDVIDELVRVTSVAFNEKLRAALLEESEA